MPSKPTLESFLENWLKKRMEPVDLRRRKPPAERRKNQNPKWNDDLWFEKEHGDPDYYKRVKGLS
jgi:hypothetical protein